VMHKSIYYSKQGVHHFYMQQQSLNISIIGTESDV
jgi:hypothetical protein